MKRICIVSPVDINNHGGIEELIRQEVEQFKSRNYEISVISVGNFDKSKGVQQIVFRNGISALIYVFFTRNRYDITHFHDPRGILFLLLNPFLKSKKRIITLHGSIFHSRSSLLRRFYFNTIIATNIKKCDVVLEPGFKLFQLSTRINPKSKLALPIKKKDFTVSRERDSIVRIHSHARFSPLKNQMKIVDLIISLREISGIDIRLILTGSSKDISYTSQLKQRSQHYSWITMIENCSPEELVQTRLLAPYFISLSKYEGFGITQVEAVQWEQYPFLYKYEGCEELFGSNATYLDTNDDSKAVSQILEIITDKSDLNERKLLRCNTTLNELSENNWENQINGLI